MKKFWILFSGFLLSIFSTVAQSPKNYDTQTMDADIYINAENKRVSGKVVYEIIIKKNTDSIVFDALNLHIKNVKIGWFKPKFYTNDKFLVIRKKFKKNKTYYVQINYFAYPVAGMYFTGYDKKKEVSQVWTQGQGRRNAHWLPVNEDKNDKFKWNLKIYFDKDFEVVSNGKKLSSMILQGDSIRKHEFVMNNPAPAYLIFVGTGKFKTDTLMVANRLKIYNFLPLNASLHDKTYYKFDEIFDFVQQEIGVPYPWENYKQYPARDFLFGGMENVAATVFNANRYVVDSIQFNDVNAVNVLAHELAHQWFGDMVTGKSDKDHWLHEGFATYYARLTDSLIFGKDYYQYEIFSNDKKIIEAAQTDTIPIHRTNASSLSYYQKGARIIQMLRKRVGDRQFKKTIISFLNRYKFANASIEDFQHELFLQTGDSLPDFFRFWLDTTNIPQFEIEQQKDSIIYKQNKFGDSLGFLLVYPKKQKKIYRRKNFKIDTDSLLTVIANPNNELLADIKFKRDSIFIENQIFYSPDFIDKYIALQQIQQWNNRRQIYDKLLKSNENSWINKEIARQIIKNPPVNYAYFLDKLFDKDLETRKFLVVNLTKIPENLKKKYISVLDDPSYESKLAVLWHYIFQYPDEARLILDRTARLKGSNDRSFRLTWLTLALLTKDYKILQKKSFFDEINNYTTADYNFNVRLNAFYTLLRLDLFTEKTIQNLLEASLHFNWHFHKRARNILKKIYKRKKYREIIDNLLKNKCLKKQKFFKKLLY